MSEDNVPAWLDHIQDAIVRAVLGRKACDMRSRADGLKPRKVDDGLALYLDVASTQVALADNVYLRLRSPRAIVRWLQAMSAQWLIVNWGTQRIAITAKHVIELGAELGACPCIRFETVTTDDPSGLVPLDGVCFLCGDCEQDWHFHERSSTWRRGRAEAYPADPEPIAQPRARCECESLDRRWGVGVEMPEPLEFLEKIDEDNYRCPRCNARLSKFEDELSMCRYQRTWTRHAELRAAAPLESAREPPAKRAGPCECEVLAGTSGHDTPRKPDCVEQVGQSEAIASCTERYNYRCAACGATFERISEETSMCRYYDQWTRYAPSHS